MTLEEIRSVIENDLKIDRFNLVDESARTPNLFSKYLNIYIEEKLKLRTYKRKYYALYKQRREYYMGTAEDDKYISEPFDRKVLRQDVDIFLDADGKLQDLQDRLVFQEAVVEILERTLKEINQRTYTIRNMQDMLKLEAGM